VLVELECEVQEQYVKDILGHPLITSEARVPLTAAFETTKNKNCKGHEQSCRVATKMLLNKSQQTHREYAGSLLKACRLIKSLKIDGKILVKAVILLPLSLTTTIKPTSFARTTTLNPLTTMGSV